MTSPTPIPDYIVMFEDLQQKSGCFPRSDSRKDDWFKRRMTNLFWAHHRELLALVRTLEQERDEARHGLYNAVYGGQSIAFDESAYPPADWPGNIDDGPPIPPELAWMVDGALAADVQDAMSIKGIPEWDHHLDHWGVTVIDRDGGLTRYACGDLVQIVQQAKEAAHAE